MYSRVADCTHLYTRNDMKWPNLAGPNLVLHFRNPLWACRIWNHQQTLTQAEPMAARGRFQKKPMCVYFFDTQGVMKKFIFLNLHGIKPSNIKPLVGFLSCWTLTTCPPQFETSGTDEPGTGTALRRDGVTHWELGYVGQMLDFELGRDGEWSHEPFLGSLGYCGLHSGHWVSFKGPIFLLDDSWWFLHISKERSAIEKVCWWTFAGLHYKQAVWLKNLRECMKIAIYLRVN